MLLPGLGSLICSGAGNQLVTERGLPDIVIVNDLLRRGQSWNTLWRGSAS